MMATSRNETNFQEYPKVLEAQNEQIKEWCFIFLAYIFSAPVFLDYCDAKIKNIREKIQGLEGQFPLIKKLYDDFYFFRDLDPYSRFETIGLSREDLEAKKRQLFNLFFVDSEWESISESSATLVTSNLKAFPYEDITRAKTSSDYIELHLPVMRNKEALHHLAQLYIDYFYEFALLTQTDALPELVNKIDRHVPISHNRYNIFVPLENAKAIEQHKKWLDLYNIHANASKSPSKKLWYMIEDSLINYVDNLSSYDEKHVAARLLGNWEEKDVRNVVDFKNKFERYVYKARTVMLNAIHGQFPISQNLSKFRNTT